jgi:hypothetical protein
MAAVLTHLMQDFAKEIPILEVQAEAQAIAARLGQGDQAIEVGTIFRRLSDAPVVPAFALFSPTAEKLPHVKSGPDSVNLRARTADEPRLLAVDALEAYRQKTAGVSKQQAFVDLFVDPLLELMFSLYERGCTLEVHPQNFMFKFDPKTGQVDKLVVRDMHGLNYSKAYREQHGLADLLSVDALQSAFPGITQKDLDSWFTRDGKLRDRFQSPAMFAVNLDFHGAIFFYQVLGALQQASYFGKADIDQLVETIRDRVELAASKHHFDLSQLPQPTGNQGSYWDADRQGIRGKILFRRAAAAK